jgi:hypothetical protein
MNPRRTIVVTALLLSAASAAIGADDPKSSAIHDGFESPRPVWRQEQTDATVRLLGHERSRRAAHDGQLSERFQFVAGVGSSFFYSYPIPRIPVTDDLKVELYVRSNRSGVRLYGRIVLPKDVDPETRQPSYVMVPGTAYEHVDRWQRIELVNMGPSIEQQARVLRASTRRPVSLEGAYLEQLVVNLFGGAGDTDVFLDDLRVAPVPAALASAPGQEPPQQQPRAEAVAVPAPEATPASTAPVKLEVPNQLYRRGKDGVYRDWLMTAIDAPGADVVKLRHAGFDLLAERPDADPARVEQAIKWGFLLLPGLDGTLEGRPIEPERMAAAASAYPFRDSVAFWGLGERLGRSPDLATREDELQRTKEANSAIRRLPDDVSRLTYGTVEGNLPLFARAPQNLSVIGIEPRAWGSAQNPTDIYGYLLQRRNLTALANPGGLFLAWLPAVPPREVQTAIWGNDRPPAWGYPQVQPEQLRLFTYIALSAGYRGIGYRAGADLTRDSGRMLAIEMALLNEEIDLCESILANGADPIPLYKTYEPDPPTLPPPGAPPTMRMPQIKENPPHPTIRAAGISTRDRRSVLLLVTDLAGLAQYQPSQMAMNNINLVVPANEAAQAFEISPGGVTPVDQQNRKRVPGGTRITLTDFGPTAIVLLTSDFGLADRFREQINRVRPQACLLAIEQARLQLRQVTEITDRLLADGHRLYDPNDKLAPPLMAGSREPNDEGDLLHKADETLKAAEEALERMDYPLAWSEARRVGRTLRHLMYAQFMKALLAMNKVVDPEPPKPPRPRRGRLSLSELKAEQEAQRNRTPVLLLPNASPPLVAYNTLPQHYLWLDFMAKLDQSAIRNLIPSGTFDDHGRLEEAGWGNQSYQLDGITANILTVAASKKEPDNRYLKMTVEPTEKADIDKFAPFFDFPAAAIRTPPVRVHAGQFLRISAMVKKPIPNPEGQGGLIICDSIGGETLQFRSSGSIPKFSRVVMFRRVPADGVMSVTMGLAGFGEVLIDDFKIETFDSPHREGTDEFAGRRGYNSAPATARRPGAGSRR